MREKMELADYELVDIENLRMTVVSANGGEWPRTHATFSAISLILPARGTN